MESARCPWAKGDNYIAYHDNEWGKPLHDDHELFELLILEGMQAGLSWITILNKRDHMRRVFDNFDAQVVAGYREDKIAELMKDPGIIRNRLKLSAMVTNAKQFLRIQREHGSFDRYLWSFVDGKPIVNAWKTQAEVPACTDLSDRMSKALKGEGFKFVGSTICYAYMQSAGLVNDHFITCPQYANCGPRG